MNLLEMRGPRYRRITGAFSVTRADSADADTHPDVLTMSGSVTFVPHFRGNWIAYPPSQFVRPEPVHARLVDGLLMTEVVSAEGVAQLQPVELIVTEDPSATQSWWWIAQFRDVTAGGEPVELAPMRFSIPPGEDPLDLSETVGIDTGAGVVTVKGPPGPGIASLTIEDEVMTVRLDTGLELPIPLPRVRPSDLPAATVSADGLMSAADKAKLDAATSNNTPDTIVRRYSNGGFGASLINIDSAPTSAKHATRKDYVDGQIAALRTELLAAIRGT